MTDPSPVRVLVVDDSTTARALLTAILGADAGIEIVGEASDGEQAIARAHQLRPSVIVMDIEMPVLDGFATTKRLMTDLPTPIVIVTARHDPRDVAISLQATQVGALTVLPKPPAPTAPDFDRQAARLVSLVKALSDVKVVRRRHAVVSRTTRQVDTPVEPRAAGRIRVVGVAASTGGPAALHRFLAALPGDLAAPVLVVQHIADGFVAGLVRWLSSVTELEVKVAVDREVIAPGTVYVGGEGAHLVADRRGRVVLDRGEEVGGFRPSATVLFASLADVYGPQAAAVVLTGMGSDGLEGVRALRQRSGLVLAQDEQTSTVFGMPRAVAEAGLADVVGPVEDLALTIAKQVPISTRWREGR